MSDLIELQRRYIAIRDAKDKLDAEAKECQKSIDELQGILAERMAAIGQPHTVVDGRRLTVRTTPRIGKRGDVTMEQLCDVLGGIPELDFLVKPAVHAGSLQSTLKEIVEEEGELPEAVEPLVRCWEQTVVAVTKA
jgi:hypothetical protein